jgi:hypothetical protein
LQLNKNNLDTIVIKKKIYLAEYTDQYEYLINNKQLKTLFGENFDIKTKNLIIEKINFELKCDNAIFKK